MHKLSLYAVIKIMTIFVRRESISPKKIALEKECENGQTLLFFNHLKNLESKHPMALGLLLT